MATRFEWSKLGLKLVCETDKRPVPRTGRAYPLPDFGTTVDALITATLELVSTAGVYGVRISTKTQGLPQSTGASWILHHTAYIGSRPSVIVWESLSITTAEINFLWENPMKGATHEFYLSVKNLQDGLAKEQSYPIVQISVPADGGGLLVAGTPKYQMQGQWTTAQADYTRMIALALAVFKNEGYATGIPTEAGPLAIAYAALSAVAPSWSDASVTTDISGYSPTVWVRWENWYSALSAMNTNIAGTLNGFYDAVADDGILSRGEKTKVAIDWETAIAEAGQIETQAIAKGLTTATVYTDFSTAYGVLYTLMVNLSPAYNDFASDTSISATDWRNAWKNYFTTKAAILLALQNAVLPLVKGVSTANIANLTTNASLSSVLDGITPVTGETFLVVAQTTKSQNGVYQAVVTPGGVSATTIRPSAFATISGTGTTVNGAYAYDTSTTTYAELTPTGVNTTYSVEFSGVPTNSATAGTLTVTLDTGSTDGMRAVTVLYSTDNGSTWNTLASYTDGDANGTFAAHAPSVALTGVTMSQVKVRINTTIARYTEWDGEQNLISYEWSKALVRDIKIDTNATESTNYALEKTGNIPDKSQWRIASGTVNGSTSKQADVASDNGVTLTDIPGTTIAVASASVLGGVKVGSGLSITGDGTLSALGVGVASFNTRTGAVTLTSADVTTALAFTPYNATNPSGFVALSSAITGYTVGANTALAATDTILAAFGKIQGQLNAKQAAGTYQPLDADLTAIAGLSGTMGLLRKTAADTWTLDTATYLTGTKVDSFNTRTGAVSLTGTDVYNALGYTAANKAGETFSGVVNFGSATYFQVSGTNNIVLRVAGGQSELFQIGAQTTSIQHMQFGPGAASTSLGCYLDVDNLNGFRFYTLGNILSATLQAGALTLQGSLSATTVNGILGLATSPSPMDGVAATGTSTYAARLDHVHPTDTSRASSSHTHTAPYDVLAFCAGKPANNAVILYVPMARACTIGTSGHFAKARVAATGASVFTVLKNGVTEVGTFTFSASGTSASFSGVSTSFSSGDILSIVGPATADSTLSDIGFDLLIGLTV